MSEATRSTQNPKHEPPRPATSPQRSGWTEFVKRVLEFAETDWYRYDELAAHIGYRGAAAS